MPLQPPKIVLEVATRGFGTVAQGERVTADFSFRNVGEAPLTVGNVKTACDCTAELISARVVPPGGQGMVRTVFDTSRIFGAQERTVTVYTNDPTQPVTTVRLRGEVTLDVAVDPPALYLGRVRRGERAANEIEIATGRPHTLRVGDAHDPVLSAELFDDAGADARSRLVVTVKADAPLGRFAAEVTINTSSSRHPVLRVPVVGFVEEGEG